MIPTAIIGAQWGDEGKGKIVDILAKDADYVVRFNGGNNAGHTVVYQGQKYPLSLLPSGILRQKDLLLAQGVVVNPQVLLSEIDFFTEKGIKPKLKIDFRVNIVMPYHRWLDAATEESKGDQKVGSLKLGIGYCYEDRNNRHGVRLEDLVNPSVFKAKLEEEYHLKKKRLVGVFNFHPLLSVKEIYYQYLAYGKRLKQYATDVSLIVSQNINRKKILFEGAHGTFLDGNFGTYPYTTAVNTISGSVFTAVGFPPQKLITTGVVKAYTTRVGGGPFPAELFDGIGNYLQEKGREVGTVSKRKRRCGWLDLPMLRLSHRLNGFDYLAITKLDVLTGLKEIKVAVTYRLKDQILPVFPSSLTDVEKVKPIYKTFNGWHEDLSAIKKYQDLPKKCRVYLEYLERKLRIPIKYISLAAERDAIIIKN